MTTVAAATAQRTRAASSEHSVGGKAATRPSSTATQTGASPTTTSSAKAGAAAVVDLSANAKAQLANLVSGAPSTSGAIGIKSFDEVVQDRSKALADTLVSRLTNLGIPLDEPIDLKLDSAGNVTTDSPYKKKIEKMFKDDPELAKEFREVAGLNAMKAAQKALEAFDKEKKAARNDEERDAAYGRYTARLMKSQDLSGTMTLDDGKLRSWSVEFMNSSVGEVAAPKASAKAEAAATQRVVRTV
ncbi:MULTISPECIES: hypothetical protein [Methylobacterium]|uniref:hypothetical protein n=1 Tax=Methylobacterium TaxID=407 RepID=UPI0013EBF77A|nr:MULTISPECIES: hypothetical protein [unclassified Methylobacterium]NGM37996.1 hypothetical protein [Methylobacterium sp. DB0501]